MAKQTRDWIAARPYRVYAAVLLSITVPLVLFSIAATHILARQMNSDSLQQSQQVALIAAAAVDGALDDAASYLQSFAARRRLHDAVANGNRRELERHLESAHELHPRFLFVSTYDLDGTMTAIFPPDAVIVGRNYAFRDWYRGVSRHWKPYVSELYQTEASPQPMVAAIAVPLVGQGGRRIGILMGAYKPETLAAVVGTISQPGAWDVSILDQRGREVAKPHGRSFAGVDRSDSAPVARALRGETGAGLFNDPQTMVAYTPAQRSGWVVLAERPVSAALQPLHTLQRQLGFFALVCLGLGASGIGLLSGHYRELEVARRFFNLSHDLFCTADFQGDFTNLNPAWEKTLGMPLEQVLATPFLELVHPEDREATLAESAKLAQGGTLLHFENRYRTAQGDYRWFLWSATASVRHQTIYAVARDVTETKDLARMKDEFVSTVSHELRTPLASLRGFAELMLERDFPEDRRREFLGIIKRESTRLASLINDFLDLQRIEAGCPDLRLEPRDIVPLLRQTVELFSVSSDRHQIVLQVPESLPRLNFDPARTSQILGNLLSNAVKYSPSGGEVTVGAHEEGKAVVIWVKDQGLGIDADAAKQLFTKFYRVDTVAHREIGGTGLGLALVRQLVELQGGRVWVESAPGIGSTFYFTLPVVPEQRAPVALTLPCAVESPDVLLIEDDAAYADLLRAHFEALGLRVATTAHAEQALQWVRIDPPRVILLDIVLPGMSGWEFLMTVKSDEMLKSIPVLVVTVTEPNVRGLVLGGADYLSKSTPPEQLVETARRQLFGKKEKSVLVVDDDALFRHSLSELLRGQPGWNVQEAGNGEDVLQIIKAGMPDLLILDLLMPVMDGFELLRRLREDKRAVNLQVLVVTGKDLSPKEADYLQRRLATLVGKREVQLDYFTEIVGRCLGRDLRPVAARRG